MRTILRPYVADFYVDGVRVIQHSVLVNQPELGAAIIGCIEKGDVLLQGEPRSAYRSTTVEIYGGDLEIDGVPMSHQAGIRRGVRRSCYIKITAGDDLCARLSECFGALCNRLQADVQRSLPGE